jgi:hypothetical protein
LLPAERPIGRVGFAPTENRRLSRRTRLLMCLTANELMNLRDRFLSKVLPIYRESQAVYFRLKGSSFES